MPNIIEHYYKDRFVGFWRYAKVPRATYVTESLRGVGAQIIFGVTYDGTPFTKERWENLCEHLGGSANPVNSFRIVPDEDYVPPAL